MVYIARRFCWAVVINQFQSRPVLCATMAQLVLFVHVSLQLAYAQAGPHGGRPRQRQRPTALPATDTAQGAPAGWILGSAPSRFEATRQPSKGRP